MARVKQAASRMVEHMRRSRLALEEQKELKKNETIYPATHHKRSSSNSAGMHYILLSRPSICLSAPNCSSEQKAKRLEKTMEKTKKEKCLIASSLNEYRVSNRNLELKLGKGKTMARSTRGSCYTCGRNYHIRIVRKLC